jgi:hypothetical protein
MRAHARDFARSPWFAIALAVVSMGVMLGFTIAYVTDQMREICGIVVLLDDRNQNLPPAADPDATRFRSELHRYRVRLGC